VKRDSEERMRLKGKIAVVTGASRGIGRGIALRLARVGARVVVNYRVSKEQAEEVVREITEGGGHAIAIQADVSDFKEAQALIKTTRARFGRVDILVNNAGIVGAHTSTDEIEPEEWRRLMDVNLTGAFFCTKAALPDLKGNRGKIVNVSSIAGKMGGTLGAHYAASKAGLIGMTFVLASELAPLVTVNAVAPGPVDTDLISDETKERLSKATPMGRIATPEEIAHAVICLLENDFISGEALNINGARYMD